MVGEAAEPQGRVPGEDNAPDLRAPGAAESLVIWASLPQTLCLQLLCVNTLCAVRWGNTEEQDGGLWTCLKYFKTALEEGGEILLGNSQAPCHITSKLRELVKLWDTEIISVLLFFCTYRRNKKFFLFKLLINLYDAVVFARSEVGQKCLKNRTRATQSKNHHQMVYKCVWLLTLQTQLWYDSLEKE